MGRTACTENQCLYNGALYLYLYFYSLYGSYSLYRASVPVQKCTLNLPITLLPLWTVQPVQRLTACTTVHTNFSNTANSPMGRTACTEPQCLYNGAHYLYLYLYSPYGPYSLCRASVPVQGCTLTLPITLLPLWVVQMYRASVPLQRCTLPLPKHLIPLWVVQIVQILSACTKVHFKFT